MSGSWVTFLSDYGLDDAFVGVCKGVLARRAPDVRIIDVCHQVARQDIAQGAVTLAAALPYLPVGVHLALIDPVGVTTTRGLAVRTADGATFVLPDNGLGARAFERAGGIVAVRALTNTALHLPRPSKLFRGRDVYAPVAGHLAAGGDFDLVGDAVDPATVVLPERRDGYVHGDHVHAEVIAVDHFGNLTLNLTRPEFEAAGVTLGDTVELRAGGRAYQLPFAVTYGEVPPGRLAVCEDANHRVTVAANAASAAALLGAHRGDPVVLGRLTRAAPTAQRTVGVLDPLTG